MIIASALGRLFKDLTVDLAIDGNKLEREVKYHYGDDKELALFIQLNRSKSIYPLLWWVVAPYYDQDSGYKQVQSKLIIFQNTQTEWLNTKRSVKSYDEIIEPTWQKVKKTLELNPFIDILGDKPKRYKLMDEPNFGASDNKNASFTKSSSGGSVSLDIVDARIIELNLRIKTNCIS